LKAIRRYKKNTGAIIETSLIESILDLQFELLTAYLNEGQKQQPERSQTGNANVYLSAPYGVYKTSDGYIAIAMIPVDHLGKLLGSDELASYTEPKSWFAHRDYIKQIISNILNHNTSSHWIEVLESADGWAAEVLNWKELFNTSAFGELDFIQELLLCNGRTIYTTRNPIRMDGHRLKCNVPAPEVGQHNTRIEKEFGL